MAQPFGFDPEALISQFSEASARQGESLRKAVHEATLKALQGRELTMKNIKSSLKQVTEAAAKGAAMNPLGAEQMEPLVGKALAGMDAALLQAVEANRRALEQLVAQGASLRETQMKKALDDMEKMEDMFFSTVRKSLGDTSGPAHALWTGALERMQIKGSLAGASATDTVDQISRQAQDTMRQGRAASMKAVNALLDSYAALASGVLIGMSQGLQGGAAAPAPAPAKSRK